MTLTYDLPKQRDAARTWQTALLRPGFADLLSSMAGEMAEYSGESLEEVRASMARAERELADAWRDDTLDPCDERQLHAFYNRRGLLEAFELLNWHAGGAGRLPIQPVMALWLAEQLGHCRVLDYGSGIGSSAVLFAQRGFEVSLADISAPLLEFARWRLAQRSLHCPSFLLPTEQPPDSWFDMILCFDVAEHVPDPVRFISRLASHLRVGGVLVATLYEDSENDRHPMHVSSCGPLDAFVRKTPLWVDWKLSERIKSWGGWSAVLRRRPGGAWLRKAEPALDFVRRLIRPASNTHTLPS